jgi:ABC-type branched-subunit amino acid transport system substrate-binding protein
VAGGLPVPADAESLDSPRPLPEPLRARLESALLESALLESALLAEAAVSPGAAPAGEAAASAPAAAASGSSAPAAAAASGSSAPAGTVVSLEGRRRKAVAAWSAVAAVLLMVVAVAGLAGRGGDSGSGSVEVAGGTTTTAGASAPVPSGAEVTAETTPPSTAGPAVAVTTRPTRPRSTPTTAGPTGSPTAVPPAPTTTAPPAGPQGGAAPPSTDQGPPPPFYDSSGSESASPAPAMSSQPGAGAAPSGDSQASPPAGQKSTQPAAGPPLRIGIIPGDAAQEAGFRAYVTRLNQGGGVRGHLLELVTTSPGAPAAGTIATVNLGSLPVAGPGGAPGWATGPLLETLTAPESLLSGSGSVFSFASPPERQGHLAADALFPSAAPAGTTAVIYAAPSGPLAEVVPQAMKAVLEARGVKVIIHTYDPAKQPGLVERDAALLSLDPAAARAWVAQARSAGYRPARGVAGIYSLADDTLAPDLPEGARVVSPYVVPSGDEGQAIRSAAGGGASASVLHGWAGAKALAAAIWRTGADTPAELQAALEGLTGWSPGLAPAYETRPGTRARTPEGVLFQVQSGTFVVQGGFRRDPY